MHARNRAGGNHGAMLTDEQFAVITRYFVLPGDDEGFNVMRNSIVD